MMLRFGILGIFILLSGAACEGCADPVCETQTDCANAEVCLDGLCTDTSGGDAGTDGGIPVSNDAGADRDAGGADPAADAGGAGPVSDAGGAEPGGDAGGDEPPSGVDAGGGSDPCERTERCSFEDEDCDGRLNNDLNCTFLASSSFALWRIDPFAHTIEVELDVDMPGTEVIFDIDQAPDGAVYATTGARKVYRIEQTGPVEVFGGTTISNSPVPRNPNGLAISDQGEFFISNQDSLIGGRIVTTDSLDEDPEYMTALEPYDSSGDCVIDKGSLLVSAVNLDDPDTVDVTDLLIRVPFNGEDPVLIGSLGFVDVYGLSSSFDLLFAVTQDGKVLHVDRDTGAAELLFETDVYFTGAANRR